MNESRLKYLFSKFYYKKATEEERREFMQLLAKPENEQTIKDLAGELWEQTSRSASVFTEAQSKEMLAAIFSEQMAEYKIPDNSAGRSLFSWRMIAAAVILIGMSSIAFLFINQNNKKNSNELHTSSKATDKIVPGSEKAFLTLADGSTIILDTAHDGTISVQGSSSVTKLNDQLVYNQLQGNSSNAPVYNTISTPRGGEYQIVLSDGSKVRLNAASSLRFPIAFTGAERSVSLTGEAFFEVAENQLQPFIVTMKERMEVKVMGTSFNVMAYDDESSIKTTLVEGKVLVNYGEDQVRLLPMQQAVLKKAGAELTIKEADIEEAIAWKDGRFYFAEDDILSIMRKLSRWYNVEVKYAGPTPMGHYAGSVRRQADITQVLEILEMPGGINFSIEANTITVSAKPIH